MSLEPATKGKIIVTTSLGPLEIDLWPKEAPKATRNFVQLCLEGYYTGTIFHRVIPGFLVQGGDPNGDGTGGESVYGPEGFEVERHSRLKFRYRGMVAMACRNDDFRHGNGSQFMMTLDRADGLNGKATLFGRISGPTIWNLSRIGELETDDNDRPLDPPKIVATEVLWDPYEGQLTLRQLHPPMEEPNQSEAAGSQSKEDVITDTCARTSLLSFMGNEEEDEEIEGPGIHSAHVVIKEDPVLSARSIAEVQQANVSVKPSTTAEAAESLKKKIRDLEAVRTVKKSDGAEPKKEPVVILGAEYGRPTNVKGLAVRKTKDRGTSALKQIEEEGIEDSQLLTPQERLRRLIRRRKQTTSQVQRESDGLQALQKFEARLKSMRRGGEDEEWFTSTLKFAVDSSTAYAFDAARDALISVNGDDALALRQPKRLRSKNSMAPRDVEEW